MIKHLKHGALNIAVAYAFAGLLWILFSDSLADFFFGSTQLITQIQTIKGFCFILVTALLLYGFINRLLKIQSHYLDIARLSEQTYKRLFTENPSCLLLVDPITLNIKACNKKAAELYGFSQEELKLITLKDLFSDEDQPRLMDWWKRHIDDNQPGPLIEFVQTNNDKQLINTQIEFNYITHRDEPTCLVNINDVTKVQSHLKSLQLALRKLDFTRHVSGVGNWEIKLTEQEILCCENATDIIELDTPPNTPIPLSDIKQNEKLAIFDKALERIRSNKNNNYIRLNEIIESDNESRHILVHAMLYSDSASESILGTFIDLTTEKQMMQQLREREMQFRTLVDLLPEGIVMFNEGKITYVNQAATKMLHAKDAQILIGQPVMNFAQASMHESIKERISRVMETPGIQEDFVKRDLLRADGEPFEAEIAASNLAPSSPGTIQLVIRDLTEPLKMRNALAEANQRLMMVSSHALELLEQDRKHAAGELHDDVGQSLTALKLGLKWLSKRTEDSLLLNKITDLQELTGNTLETVRNLSLKLRPAQLDTLGLTAAIKWQAERLFIDSGINFSLDHKDLTSLPDKDIEIIVFRLIQESLTNTVRHSHASSVEVKLSSTEEVLELSVIDDGIGFDPKISCNSLGLVNMKERAALIGGELNIRSLKNVGTEVHATLPLQKHEIENFSKQLFQIKQWANNE